MIQREAKLYTQMALQQHDYSALIAPRCAAYFVKDEARSKNCRFPTKPLLEEPPNMREFRNALVQSPEYQTPNIARTFTKICFLTNFSYLNKRKSGT